MNDIIRKGKRLAFLLRHDEEYQFDEHGWHEVSDLIANHGYTMELLDEIVETNNKKRYEFSEDKTKIRARQGHSINVDVELKETTPPDILYHGTAETTVPIILKEGIVKGNRLHVHLSQTEETAVTTGRRYGKPYGLRINTKQLGEDGIKSYLSTNGAWLTE